MHTLVILDRQRAIEQNATRAILGIDVVICGPICRSSRHTGPALVYGPVLATVWVGHQALEQGVAWVPVRREVAIGVGQVAGVDVLAEA